jgi:hypothetical protein
MSFEFDMVVFNIYTKLQKKMTQINTFKRDKAYRIENLNRNLIFKVDVIRQSLNKTV